MRKDTPELQSAGRVVPSTKPDDHESVSQAWTVTFMLFLVATISILDRNIITLLIDPIKHDFGLSDTQIGFLVGAAFALPFGAFVIPIGWAVDRMQRRSIIAAGVAVWSSATVATGLAGTFATLVAARSLIGASDASIGPATASWMGDLFPAQRLGLPMAVTNLGYKFGQGVALLAGGALAMWFVPGASYEVPLIGSIKGWQVIFIVVGLPGLAFAPLVLMMHEPTREPMGKDATNEAGFRTFLAYIRANRAFFIPHHLGFFALVAMTAVILTWSPAFFVRAHGWSESMAGSKLGLAILIGPLLGLPLHGALADYLYRKGWLDIHLRYPLIAMVAGAPILLFVFLVGQPDLAVFLLGVFWFVVSAYTSLPLTALVGVTPPRLRGKAISVVGLVSGTSGLVCGPLLVGTFSDAVFGDPEMVGYSIICSIACLLPLFVVCFALALRPLRAMAALAKR